MNAKKREKTINVLQWLGFLIPLCALVFSIFSFYKRIQFNQNVVLSNLFALYALVLGAKEVFEKKRKQLAYFYLFFGVMMLIVVNVVFFRFG